MPPSRRVTETTSKNGRPEIVASRRSWAATRASPSIARWIALSASHGRAAWPLTPLNVTRAVSVPTHPACTVRSVGSSRIARSASWTSGHASKSAGSGLWLGGSSSRPNRSNATSTRPGLRSREVAHELERDGDAALHVARAASVHRAVGDPAGNVVLGRDGVVVAREHEQRDVGPALARPQVRLVALEDRRERLGHERADPLPDLRLVQALRADVDELERAAAEAVCELAHGAERTVQEAGAYFRPWPRQSSSGRPVPSPNGASCSPCSRKAWTATRSSRSCGSSPGRPA